MVITRSSQKKMVITNWFIVIKQNLFEP